MDVTNFEPQVHVFEQSDSEALSHESHNGHLEIRPRSVGPVAETVTATFNSSAYGDSPHL